MLHVAEAEVDPAVCTFAYQPARTSKLPRGPEHRRAAATVDVDDDVLAVTVAGEEVGTVDATVLKLDGSLVPESLHAAIPRTIMRPMDRTATRVGFMTGDATDARSEPLETKVAVEGSSLAGSEFALWEARGEQGDRLSIR